MATPRRAISVLLASAMLATMAFAESASAAATCKYDPVTLQLSVTVNGSTEAILKRSGESIRLSQSFGPDFTCEGAPTVTNTDLIAISTKGFSGVLIELKGGPFAPGATAETGDTSEIEFGVSGTGNPGGITFLQGLPSPDRFQFLTAGGVAGLNMNPGPGDKDVDIAMPDPRKSKAFFVAAGGGGKDTIEVIGRPLLLPFAEGGGGDDTMLAGNAFGSIFDGGAGRDRLVGSSGFDLLIPGPGADRVSAGGDDDTVEMTPDGSRDRIDCGAGRDEAGRRDRIDRVRSCERLAKDG